MNKIIEQLSAPFPVKSVSWRVGPTNKEKTSGIALAYIDARDAMERLDSVVGPENWQRRYPWAVGNKLCCEVGLRFDGEWVWKADGAGDTDIEAEKGAFSDAFKRACVNWGISRYLYDLPNTWFPIENNRFTRAAITEMTARLQAWQDKKFHVRENSGGVLGALGGALRRPDDELIIDLRLALQQKPTEYVVGLWGTFGEVTRANALTKLTEAELIKLNQYLSVPLCK